VWILLAAAIAFRTCLGALAGGMAVPSAWILAVPLGAVGVVVVVVLPGAAAPPVWAIAGTAPASEATNSSPANANFLLLLVYDRKPFSFVGLRG
jgi:tellurite resistance protein TehA-like permease